MATHSTAAISAATNAVTALINAVSPPGKLVFRTAGDVAVATLTFSNPAFPTTITGTATASAITQDGSATGNASPVTKATLQTGEGTPTIVVTATVAASSAEINMSNGIVINPGDTVSVSSLTYRAITS